MGMFIGIKMGNIIKYANKKEIKNMSLPKEAVKKRMPIFSGKNPKQLLRKNFIDYQTSTNEVDKTKEVNEGDNLCDIDRNIDKENQQDTGITESHLSPESETPEEELFRFYSVPRQAKLPKGKYCAMIKEVTVAPKVGVYGKFIGVRIKFSIQYDHKSIIVSLLTYKDMLPTSKLSQLVKVINGEVPCNGFDLRDLTDEEVEVEVGHRTDENGNTWEEVLSVEKYR